MLAPSLPHAEVVSISDAEAIRGEWIDLSRRAVEPNPFYEIDYLAALYRHVRPKEALHLVLVRDRATRQLDGLFPITVKGAFDGYPGGATVMSYDTLIGQTVPLIAGSAPADIWRAFLAFVDKHDDLPPLVHLKEFYADSPCGTALAEACREERAIRRRENAFERAVAASDANFEAYTQRWSRKKARNIRSRAKKLAAAGNPEFALMVPETPGFAAALGEILTLEKAGWKGHEGTALASQDDLNTFAREAFGASRNTPRIALGTLRLDGRLLAGQINLMAQKRIYFIKSAYDEGHASFGPGVALYSEMLRRMLDENMFEKLDSCADGGHPLEEIWLERECVESVFVATGSPSNSRAADRLIALRNGLRKLRDTASSVQKLVTRQD
ncbi:MAG: GNAT family N-acetyltransferase [Rhizobiaceae bacterium]|nr:GNAT family N-acetyltransferase [Rhizobiaceae bacterium]